MEPTKFEKDIFKYFINLYKKEVDFGFYCDNFQVIERVFTGAGCFVYLKPISLENVSLIQNGDQYGAIEGPSIASPELLNGAYSLFHYTHGVFNNIEIFGMDGIFPRHELSSYTFGAPFEVNIIPSEQDE